MGNSRTLLNSSKTVLEAGNTGKPNTAFCLASGCDLTMVIEEYNEKKTNFPIIQLVGYQHSLPKMWQSDLHSANVLQFKKFLLKLVVVLLWYDYLLVNDAVSYFPWTKDGLEVELHWHQVVKLCDGAFLGVISRHRESLQGRGTVWGLSLHPKTSFSHFFPGAVTVPAASLPCGPSYAPAALPVLLVMLKKLLVKPTAPLFRVQKCAYPCAIR